ncbi:hypothetical protein Tco_0062696, partial [Tanacetum coccineum]
NLAWIIADDLCKHAPGLKENSLICRGHYVTKIAKSLGYLVDEEVAKSGQANYAYPTYEPPNVPPYPYPYVPYPHLYMRYPDMGNQSHGGGHYGAPGDGNFVGLMPSFEGTSIVPSSGYEVRGSPGAI